jgi:hypothetical protein
VTTFSNSPQRRSNSEDAHHSIHAAQPSSPIPSIDLNVDLSPSPSAETLRETSQGLIESRIDYGKLRERTQFFEFKLVAGEVSRLAASIAVSAASWMYVAYNFWTQPWFAGVVAVSAGLLLYGIKCREDDGSGWPESTREDVSLIKERIAAIVTPICDAHSLRKPDICIGSTEASIVSILGTEPFPGISLKMRVPDILVLPDSLCDQATEPELRAIICHELAHSLQRSYFLKKFAQIIVRSSALPLALTAVLTTSSLCESVVSGVAGKALTLGACLGLDFLRVLMQNSIGCFVSHASEFHADLLALRLSPIKPENLISAIVKAHQVATGSNEYDHDRPTLSHPSLNARRKNLESVTLG